MIFNDIMMIMILEWVIFSVDSAFEIRSVLILLSHLKWSSALCSLSLALFNDMRVFRCASTSSTYPCQFVRRFVRSSYFRISLSPHKASRRHCGGRHVGGQGSRQDGLNGGRQKEEEKKRPTWSWTSGLHEDGHGGRDQHQQRHRHGNPFGERVGHGCWLIGQFFLPEAYPACAST